MSKDIILKISKISKSFSDYDVLNDISFNVKKNDIYGFVGLNGQGKTTLIKIIINLLEADEGEIEIFGDPVDNPLSRQKLFYLPEKFQPSLYLTGFEFLKFSQGFYNRQLDLKRCQKICNDIDLRYDALKLPIKKYSKGMTQKLGLLALFLSEADFVILDEPMSGLDPKARINLKNELLAYKKLGKTIFFSSHILSDIDEICDSIAVLNNSKIIFEGRPKTFKDKYRQQDLDKAFLMAIE